jgi:formate dehydrogenase maturation protein FdhE
VTTPGNASRARALRALELARTSPSAREPLEFVAELCEAQARAREELGGAAAWSGSLVRDGARLLEPLRPVAACIAEPSLEELHSYWSGEATGADGFVARSLLRPYVELLRELEIAPDRPRAAGHCPFCGGAALLALRRGGAPGDGALRSLLCALCGLEWNIPRIRCPVCAEADPARLPVFSAAEYPAARIEACESCRRYLKSLELGAGNRVLPEVDELASLALDLWAQEQGFTREPNFAGL